MVTFWVHVTRDERTGAKTVSYSHTPEQVVQMYKDDHAQLCVAKGRCPECPFLSDRLYSFAATAKMEAEYLEYQRIPECVKSGVLNNDRRGNLSLHLTKPAIIHCQWFAQRHLHENIFLHALDAAGLLVYYDVTDLDTVSDRKDLDLKYDLVDF